MIKPKYTQEEMRQIKATHPKFSKFCSPFAGLENHSNSCYLDIVLTLSALYNIPRSVDISTEAYIILGRGDNKERLRENRKLPRKYCNSQAQDAGELLLDLTDDEPVKYTEVLFIEDQRINKNTGTSTPWFMGMEFNDETYDSTTKSLLFSEKVKYRKDGEIVLAKKVTKYSLDNCSYIVTRNEVNLPHFDLVCVFYIHHSHYTASYKVGGEWWYYDDLPKHIKGPNGEDIVRPLIVKIDHPNTPPRNRVLFVYLI